MNKELTLTAAFEAMTTEPNQPTFTDTQIDEAVRQATAAPDALRKAAQECDPIAEGRFIDRIDSDGVEWTRTARVREWIAATSKDTVTMTDGPRPRTIVAEVSKSWPNVNTTPVAKLFEHVVARNQERGYELTSWHFSQCFTPAQELAETIIAVFDLRPEPKALPPSDAAAWLKNRRTAGRCLDTDPVKVFSHRIDEFEVATSNRHDAPEGPILAEMRRRFDIARRELVDAYRRVSKPSEPASPDQIAVARAVAGITKDELQNMDTTPRVAPRPPRGARLEVAVADAEKPVKP